MLQLLTQTRYVSHLALCTVMILYVSMLALHVLYWSCISSVQIEHRDLEYKKAYNANEKELQFAVVNRFYPPAISCEITQSKAPRHLQSHKRIHLRIYGAKGGVITFPIDVLEEKEGLCDYVLVLYLSVGISRHGCTIPHNSIPEVVKPVSCQF